MGQEMSTVSKDDEGARLSKMDELCFLKTMLSVIVAEPAKCWSRRLFGSAEGTYFLAYMVKRGYGGPKDERRAEETARLIP